MGHAGMVFNLEQIQCVEDKNLLSGHILVLLGQDFDAAQASLLKLAFCQMSSDLLLALQTMLDSSTAGTQLLLMTDMSVSTQQNPQVCICTGLQGRRSMLIHDSSLCFFTSTSVIF